MKSLQKKLLNIWKKWEPDIDESGELDEFITHYHSSIRWMENYVSDHMRRIMFAINCFQDEEKRNKFIEQTIHDSYKKFCIGKDKIPRYAKEYVDVTLCRELYGITFLKDYRGYYNGRIHPMKEFWWKNSNHSVIDLYDERLLWMNSSFFSHMTVSVAPTKNNSEWLELIWNEGWGNILSEMWMGERIDHSWVHPKNNYGVNFEKFRSLIWEDRAVKDDEQNIDEIMNEGTDTVRDFWNDKFPFMSLVDNDTRGLKTKLLEKLEEFEPFISDEFRKEIRFREDKMRKVYMGFVDDIKKSSHPLEFREHPEFSFTCHANTDESKCWNPTFMTEDLWKDLDFEEIFRKLESEKKTKLTWTCDYIDGSIFHTGIKGNKKYEKGIKEFIKMMPTILSENEKLYEEMMGMGKFRKNKCMEEHDIWEFLYDFEKEDPDVLKQAEVGYSMGGDDAEGVLFVDRKPFPPPENWKDRGEGFWCGGEHHYDEKLGHTFEADGKILFRWNKDHDEKNRYMDVLNGEGAISDFKRFREGKWELEIDGDFDYMKLDFDAKKCRVLYDGKEFIKVKDGVDVTDRGHQYFCFYKGEQLPKDEYMWEGYEFPEDEDAD